ncbi:hypothetical protein BROUX41_000923 [Berkeleyomyces rouxiae]|uniref:uncharacterized protein n=1 Tax=Berkeleyomyces rouxiae TaxID=2035830 RepID=UPI003B7FBD7B
MASEAATVADPPPRERRTTLQDVLEVRELFTEELKLPMELVDQILDMGEFWPSSQARTSQSYAVMQRHSDVPGFDGNLLVLRTGIVGKCTHPDQDALPPQTWSENNRPSPPAHPNEALCTGAAFRTALGPEMPLLLRPVRKIVFTICSHDQGWSSNYREPENEYAGSYTWFEVGLERFAQGDDEQINDIHNLADTRTVIPKALIDGDVTRLDLGRHSIPDDNLIQKNRHANRKTTEHCIEWRWDDDIEPDTKRATTELQQKGRGLTTGTGKFVRSLQAGDIITVWAKARFPGWRNEVESVAVDVYWAF